MLPQPHFRPPSATAVMWPISPASPECPLSSRPPSITPRPTPVLDVEHREVVEPLRQPVMPLREAQRVRLLKQHALARRAAPRGPRPARGRSSCGTFGDSTPRPRAVIDQPRQAHAQAERLDAGPRHQPPARPASSAASSSG